MMNGKETRMRWTLLAAFSTLNCMMAQAAPVLPDHLGGTWGTAESLYAGQSEQVQLFVESDGLGMLAGSSRAPMHKDRKTVEPALRAIMGMPVRVTLDKDQLILHPFFFDKTENAKAQKLSISCRVVEVGLLLQCQDPDGKTFAMKRFGATIAADAAKTITAIRTQAAAIAR